MTGFTVALIADMRFELPMPALSIIGEPTGMRIGLAHRGQADRFLEAVGLWASESADRG